MLTTTDSSKFATSYKWYFGDGDSAVIAAPSHTYAVNGIYTLTLIVSNDCGSDTIERVIELNWADGVVDQQISNLLIYPNPATSQLFIDLKEYPGKSTSMYILDMKGDILLRDNNIQAGSLVKIDVSSFSAGTYLLRGVIDQKVFVHRKSITK